MYDSSFPSSFVIRLKLLFAYSSLSAMFFDILGWGLGGLGGMIYVFSVVLLVSNCSLSLQWVPVGFSDDLEIVLYMYPNLQHYAMGNASLRSNSSNSSVKVKRLNRTA